MVRDGYEVLREDHEHARGDNESRPDPNESEPGGNGSARDLKKSGRKDLGPLAIFMGVDATFMSSHPSVIRPDVTVLIRHANF